MGDNLVPNGLSRGCGVFCSQIDISEIVEHEADEPDALVNFLDAPICRPVRTTLAKTHKGETRLVERGGLSFGTRWRAWVP
jgi:hypothetical protein